MRAKALIITALALAGCGAAAPEHAAVLGGNTPEGGWPVLGTVTGSIGGNAHVWNSYDFSVGAFDASAWIEGRMLNLIFYPEGLSDAKEGLLHVEAPLIELSRSAALAGPARVQIVDNAAWDAPRLRDLSGRVVITRFLADQALSESGYGTIAGSILAQLCEATGGGCVPFVGRFETRLQISP